MGVLEFLWLFFVVSLYVIVSSEILQFIPLKYFTVKISPQASALPYGGGSGAGGGAESGAGAGFSMGASAGAGGGSQAGSGFGG